MGIRMAVVPIIGGENVRKRDLGIGVECEKRRQPRLNSGLGISFGGDRSYGRPSRIPRRPSAFPVNALRSKSDEHRAWTNHYVLRVGKKGPTTPVNFLNDERIWDERRFLF